MIRQVQNIHWLRIFNAEDRICWLLKICLAGKDYKSTAVPIRCFYLIEGFFILYICLWNLFTPAAVGGAANSGRGL